MSSAVHTVFTELFSGRYNAVGGDDGACIRAPLGADRSWWMGRVHDHLTGKRPCGVYPLTDELTVKWGCVDIDLGYDEAWPHAVNVAQALEVCGIKPWLERSRSKGYHIWVFADSWVPALTMRTALKAACQLVQYTDKEVNPKQVSLEGLMGYGNYVRLPYPAWLAVDRYGLSLERQVMVRPDGSTIGVVEFVETAYATRTPVQALDALATLYTPPSKPVVYRDWAPGAAAPKSMPTLAKIIFEDGPLDGMDRSSALFKFCAELARAGFAREDMIEHLAACDEQPWARKFTERNDRERQYERMVDRAIALAR